MNWIRRKKFWRFHNALWFVVENKRCSNNRLKCYAIDNFTFIFAKDVNSVISLINTYHRCMRLPSYVSLENIILELCRTFLFFSISLWCECQERAQKINFYRKNSNNEKWKRNFSHFFTRFKLFFWRVIWNLMFCNNAEIFKYRWEMFGRD